MYVLRQINCLSVWGSCLLLRHGHTWRLEVLHDPGLEFAVDLCAGSSPSQIVVARIKSERSLGQALEIPAGDDLATDLPQVLEAPGLLMHHLEPEFEKVRLERSRLEKEAQRLIEKHARPTN